jgi:RHS repeat-associated protein
MVAPDGEEAGLRYDALGRTTERWGPDPSYAGKGANWLLESIAYVEPSPALELPGRIRRDAVGTTPSVTFYDALGRKIATKASIETTTDTSVVLVSDLAAYDSFGRPIALAAPIVAGDQDNIEMLATDFVATPISEHTTTVYDVRTGKRTQVRPPDAATVEFEYRSPGLEITRDPSGLMRISYLDALGRTYATERCVDPLDLDAITPSYRCPVIYRRQRLEYAFDGMDRPTTSWVQNLEIAGEPMEWLRAINYDGLGNQIRIRDRNSGEWLKSFDKRGQHVGTLGPDGAETSFKYKKGRLIETRVEHPYAADKLITKRTYVRRGELGAGQLESITTKDGLGTTARTLSYTPRGLVAREAIAISTLVDGEVFTSSYSTTTTYDEADRVLSIAYPTTGASGHVASEQVSVGHNAHGQVTTLTSSNGQTFVSDVDYDLYGNTVSVDYGNQLSDHYAYARHEDGGRLECMRTTVSSLSADGCALSSGSDYRSLAYERDISGRIIKIDDRHSDASEAHSFNYDAAYHDDGRLAAATYRSALSVPVDKDEYEYDTLGRVTARIRTDAQVAVTLAYEYGSALPDDNPNGPIVPLHRLQSYGATAVQYDAAGRQIAKGDTEYVYDQVGRLREVHSNDALVTLHQYDEGESRVAKYFPATDTLIHYFGNLFEIHIDAGTQSAELVRHFSLGGGRVASDRSLAPDGLVVVASTAAGAARSSPRSIHTPKTRPLAHPHQDASAAVARSALSHLAWAVSAATGGAILFGIALFPDRRCVAFSTTALLVFSVIPIPHIPQWLLGNAQAQSLPGSLVYYHTDHLGSVQLITDDNPSGGQLVESIRYRAYGEVRGIFGDPPAYVEENPPVPETTAGYGGHEVDSESGLLYFGARHYDPELAMFLTPDAAAQFPSPFSYSAWDPVNNFDPDGNFAFLATLIAVLQFVSQVMAIGFAIAAIVMNPSAGPMAAVQQYVLSVAGGGWKGIGTLLLSALAKTPGSFQSAVQTAHVANSGLGTAMAIRDGDTLGAIASISSAAAGNGGTGEIARGSDNSGSPAGSLEKYLNSDATASATPSAGPSMTTGIDGPMIDAAYHVSRPLIGSGNAVLSHNYISTHADFIGDPNATLSSFGESLDGTLDRMTGSNAGSFSAPTVNADRQHWLSLAGSGAGRDVVPIPASSTKVERLLASFPGGYDYAAIAGPFGFNSNSASQWVANMAAGSPQPIPGEPGRLAPGARNWFRIPRGR